MIDHRINEAVRSSKSRRKPSAMPGVLAVIGKILLVILTAVAALAAALIIVLNTICNGPSESAKEVFVTTVLESGQMKFLASLFLSDEEISDIVSRTAMGTLDAEVDSGLISIDITETEEESIYDFDENGIDLIEISGRTYFAKMLVIKDPSKVKLATTYPWSEYGKELGELVTESGAVAGVNGGLYVSSGNKGGSPLGIAVCEGEIQYNRPENWAGLYLIGFDNNDVLQIISIAGMTAAETKALVEERGIRDAVSFQDETSDANNHFVPLIINGEKRELSGQGSGANPRTAIGQRADGTVLLLVTDGRGAGGHLGATASDLISVMAEHGAVNAANLDGGSSSCMYYNDQYEMTSVTLYYANASWKLPTAFVVEGGGSDAQ